MIGRMRLGSLIKLRIGDFDLQFRKKSVPFYDEQRWNTDFVPRVKRKMSHTGTQIFRIVKFLILILKNSEMSFRARSGAHASFLSLNESLVHFAHRHVLKFFLLIFAYKKFST